MGNVYRCSLAVHACGCAAADEAGPSQNYKSQLVEEMGDLMIDAGMVNVLPLPKARVPVVKFGVPETGTKVNLPVRSLLW